MPSNYRGVTKECQWVEHLSRLPWRAHFQVFPHNLTTKKSPRLLQQLNACEFAEVLDEPLGVCIHNICLTHISIPCALLLVGMTHAFGMVSHV